MTFTSQYDSRHYNRFKKTLSFLKKTVPINCKILDLGIKNPLSELMEKEGYIVSNTKGEDLDFDLTILKKSNAEVLTAFEIFEHLLSPFNILVNTNATKLLATVPLKLWFSSAYRSKIDPFDRHYHEFEDWQFDLLFEKTGWTIIDREKWVSPAKITGIRPLLRNFTPRHYAVYAERRK